MSEEHHRKLEAMYGAAPVNAPCEPRLEVREGEATLVMEVRACHFHAAGSLHGSVYFKALDDAAFFAVNSLVEDVFVLTTSFTVYLLRPVRRGRSGPRAGWSAPPGRSLSRSRSSSPATGWWPRAAAHSCAAASAWTRFRATSEAHRRLRTHFRGPHRKNRPIDPAPPSALRGRLAWVVHLDRQSAFRGHGLSPSCRTALGALKRRLV